MRRIGILVVVAVVGLSAATFALLGHGKGGDYRVGAVFDTARGISKGSVVKIAGATVGEVADVRLTAEQQALIVMDVEPRFRPFRADATCAVRPEGLIGVRSIDCDPGTSRAAALKGSRLPIVALRRTQVPIDITDFFSIWAAPTRDRLRLLINELGIGLVARGGDFNALLLRSSPALRQTRRALAILDAQRGDIRELVTASDQVIGDLADHASGLRSTLREAATTFSQVADEREALRQGIRDLPAALSTTRTGLHRLVSFSDAAIPVLGDLRRASGAIESALTAAPGFAAQARPALRALSPALATTQRTLVQAAPVTRRLERFTRDASPSGRLLAELLVDARDRGAVENIMHLSYIGAAIGSRFDRISHLFPTSPLSVGCNYEDTPEAKCDSRYDKTYADEATRRSGRRHAAGSPSPAAPAAAGATPTPAPAIRPQVSVPDLPLPQLPNAKQTVDDLLNFLLRP